MMASNYTSDIPYAIFSYISREDLVVCVTFCDQSYISQCKELKIKKKNVYLYNEMNKEKKATTLLTVPQPFTRIYVYTHTTRRVVHTYRTRN